MQDPGSISISDFTYLLPPEKIAHYPLAERDASKLLIYREGELNEDIYKNIDTHLPADSLLVFNNTKVVAARMLFQKPSGGIIELFCLEPAERFNDMTMAMARKGKVQWHCLVGGASKWKSGQVLKKKIGLPHKEIILEATYLEKKTDSFVIEFSWSPSALSFAEILQDAGAIPLPPYIKRKPEITDAERYQTVYAEREGSVASPTAGLHFTPAVFTKLNQKNIQQDFITLHVGAGTFKPVKSETMKTHEMHAEWINVSKKNIETILQNLDHPVIAVGTTSLRTIESLYWMGLKLSIGKNNKSIPGAEQVPDLSQWECYELAKKNLPVKQALNALLAWMEKHKMERLLTKTQIIIVPGYPFKIVNALITNFHQPQSTLLLLVAALTGADWKTIYQYALENNFRFLSYGDGSLLWRKKIKLSGEVFQW